MDIKHEWIKSWQICFTCSDAYSNKDINEASQYLKEKDHNNVISNSVINQIISTKQKSESEKRRISLQKYIENKMDEIMVNSNGGGFRKRTLNRKPVYDDNYISYVENGESAAVFLIRDNVGEIKTDGMWIDIVSLDTYEKYGRLGFNYIIVELFSRKIKPKYPPKGPNESEKVIKIGLHILHGSLQLKILPNREMKEFVGQNIWF